MILQGWLAIVTVLLAGVGLFIVGSIGIIMIWGGKILIWFLARLERQMED
jgi:hypothetical protein